MKLCLCAPNVKRWSILLCALSGVHCGTGGSGGKPAGTAGSDSSGGHSTGGKPAQDGGSKSSGGAVTIVPGAPQCGLDSAAAFCDSFDAPAKMQGRAGELDATRWSGSRAQPQLPTNAGLAIGIGAAKLPACRDGLPSMVYPDQDSLICDANQAIPSNHLLVLAAAQNYGQNSYRVRQPFDFAGRTGKVVFDAEGFVKTQLLGWNSVAITEDPIPAPSFSVGGPTTNNDEGGQLPRNGFEIQLQDNCAGFHAPPVVGVRMLLIYNDYVATVITPDSHVCPKTQEAHLNHFELSVSESQIELYGSDYSEKDGTFGEAQLLLSADVSLPFSRGYVSFSTHNHATAKYAEENDRLDAWLSRWDNVGFDGPKLTNTREYEVPDALRLGQNEFSPGSDYMNIGYRVADVADGPSDTLHFANVDPSGMSKAQLSLSCWYLASDQAKTYALRYRFNAGEWHDRPITEAEANILTGGSSLGQLAQMIDVPVGELVVGDNTVEFVTSNVPQGYPPVVSNIDLILTK